mmetsp:Transcript_40061/g.113589  ORF Transcript_40061/g.113589 Transcript_40061/m.113589 type:complete len:316 (+) Transcript_40061:3-950(+)
MLSSGRVAGGSAAAVRPGSLGLARCSHDARVLRPGPDDNIHNPWRPVPVAGVAVGLGGCSACRGPFCGAPGSFQPRAQDWPESRCCAGSRRPGHVRLRARGVVVGFQRDLSCVRAAAGRAALGPRALQRLGLCRCLRLILAASGDHGCPAGVHRRRTMRGGAFRLRGPLQFHRHSPRRPGHISGGLVLLGDSGCLRLGCFRSRGGCCAGGGPASQPRGPGPAGRRSPRYRELRYDRRALGRIWSGAAGGPAGRGIGPNDWHRLGPGCRPLRRIGVGALQIHSAGGRRLGGRSILRPRRSARRHCGDFGVLEGHQG